MADVLPNDDVASLCRRVDIAPSLYKRFPSPLQVRSTTDPAARSGLRDTAERNIDRELVRAMVAEEPLVFNDSFQLPKEREVNDPAYAPLLQPLAALSASLMPDASPAADYISKAHETPAFLKTFVPVELPAERTPDVHVPENPSTALSLEVDNAKPWFLPIFGAVGGAGVTTTLACLGRALGILGEEVLLVDRGLSSTLHEIRTQDGLGTDPSRASKAGTFHTFDPATRLEGSVHVLNASEGPHSQQPYPSTLPRAVAQLRSRIDRVLLAQSFGVLNSDGRKGWSDSSCLVIVPCERRGLLALPDIEKLIDQAPGASKRTVYFVLNRFDRTEAQHLALRSAFHARLGQRLLRFSLPETPELKNFSANPVHFLDALPQSEWADSIFELADWCRTHSSVKDSSGTANQARPSSFHN